ncbi:unnamed protein product [Chrysodeixis includens]|uniref:Uncharacterized protein n=1 Tax=Chrysodeixis includens TaxID=689277 RepID=A0A9P0FYA6_CHRIL|nr:unnamed protein product [Chrysodeixis includens]
MWQLIPVLLYVSSAQALYRLNANNPYPYFNEDQANAPAVAKHGIDYSSFNGGSGLSFTDDPVNDQKDSQSYAADLELVENFANYLRKRTQLDPVSAGSPNDAAHQYNAILAVLIALARAIRNSCVDFEQIYDGIYFDTVDTYYKYGLANADKVAGMIEEYIRKGNSHITKLRALKQEICEKEIFCAVSLNNHIKSSPLLYVKELETLEALTHLAQSYYPYIEEFNQATQKGNALAYLQRSKERLKEYIMHIINSIEHITDRQVTCP